MNDATLEAPTVDLEGKTEAKKRRLIKVELAEGGTDTVSVIEMISPDLLPPFELEPNATVEVLLNNGTVKKESFYECLLSVGIRSMDYYYGRKEFAKETNFHDLMQRLHIEKLRQREVDCPPKDEQYTDQFTSSGEKQVETTKEHGVVWKKIINDLKIPGLTAVSARVVEDEFDGIDEFLRLDVEALKSRGARSSEPVYVGIQRSFNNKLQEVRDSHDRGIAEKSDLGLIFRVFIREELHQYEGVFKKLQEAADKGLRNIKVADAEEVRTGEMTEAEYRRAYLESIPIVNFIGDEKRQAQRVKEILDVTKNELEFYLSIEQLDCVKEKLKLNIKAVDRALEAVKDRIKLFR